jgi:hypothetical protein
MIEQTPRYVPGNCGPQVARLLCNAFDFGGPNANLVLGAV